MARARCLFRLQGLLEENFEELSRIQTMEHGKTIDESRGETRRGIENVEVATGIPSLMQGDYLEDIATGIDDLREGVDRIAKASRDKDGFQAFVKEGKRLY